MASCGQGRSASFGYKPLTFGEYYRATYMLPQSFPFFSSRHRMVTLGHFGPAWPPWFTSLIVDRWGLCRYRLPVNRLDTHSYIVGRSGKGKSKFIEGFLWQLMTLGQGCGLLDPHADLANNLLKMLAFQPIGKDKEPWLKNPDNAGRLIYCEPGRNDFLIPWNVLKSDDKPYTVASNIVEAFQRTWSATLSAAPQFKNITLHSLMLLIEHKRTLVDFRDCCWMRASEIVWLTIAKTKKSSTFSNNGLTPGVNSNHPARRACLTKSQR